MVPSGFNTKRSPTSLLTISDAVGPGATGATSVTSGGPNGSYGLTGALVSMLLTISVGVS